MGGGHDHHGPPVVKFPDASIYKVENIPRLMAVKEALEKKGLKDPWLRNEAWRYDPKQFEQAAWKNGMRFLFRGFVPGFVLFGLTIAYDELTKDKNAEHGHH